jgi:hypothetical protein
MNNYEYKIIRARYDWVYVQAGSDDPDFESYLKATDTLIRYEIREDLEGLPKPLLDDINDECRASYDLIQDMIDNKKIKRVEEVLNQSGNNGWELVSAVKRTEGIYHYFLKRAKE